MERASKTTEMHRNVQGERERGGKQRGKFYPEEQKGKKQTRKRPRTIPQSTDRETHHHPSDEAEQKDLTETTEPESP